MLAPRLLALTAALWLSGILWPAAALAKLQVVASLSDLASLAREVGGPDAEVTALAAPTQDPHFVDARPSLMLPLNRADLLVQTGLQLESGWLPNLIGGARNPRIQPGASGHFEAAGVVSLKQVPTQAINRSMGDLHPGGNPHFLLDPREGAKVALALAGRMGQLDPSHRAGYVARGAALARACEKLAADEARRFGALAPERRKIVTYHTSLIYLFEWLGLQQIDTLEPKPGIAPSPEHVAQVLLRMRQEKVPAIVYEDYRPQNVGRLVADKAGARLLLIPGGPDFEGGQNYLSYLRGITDRLREGLDR